MSPGFIVSVLATLTTGLITLWLLYEDWAVWHSDKSGKPPLSTSGRMAMGGPAGDNTITAWTRYYERLLDQHHKSHWLLIAAVILGLLIGHLTWH